MPSQKPEERLYATYSNGPSDQSGEPVGVKSEQKAVEEALLKKKNYVILAAVTTAETETETLYGLLRNTGHLLVGYNAIVTREELIARVEKQANADPRPPLRELFRLEPKLRAYESYKPGTSFVEHPDSNGRVDLVELLPAYHRVYNRDGKKIFPAPAPAVTPQNSPNTLGRG
jgi:hypothetical protein